MSKKSKFALLITLVILLFLMALYLTWGIVANIATIVEYTAEEFPAEIAEIYVPRCVVNILFNLVFTATSVASAIVLCMLIAKLNNVNNKDE